MKLACDNIIATKATQVRTKLHKDVIDAYCQDIKDGAVMPAVDVFAENGSEAYYLADGFQRLLAAVNAGKEQIEVEVHEGGIHDALMFALGANTTHGLRRSNADKIRAVKMALKDPEISRHTQREIADICRVDRTTVQRVSRRELLDKTESKKAAKQPNETESKPNQPEQNKPSNKRATKPPPTQAQVDRDELRKALAAIRAFPYPGGNTKRLRLSKADIKELEYVSEWTAHAVLAYRNV